MSQDDTPPRPSRLIVPGAEDEPQPRKPLIVGASGEPLGAAEEPASRIVLPPGAARETADDLPEHPRLRPLVIVPVRDRGRDLLLVTDPLGLLPAPIALQIEMLDFLRLLDGRFSLTELSAEIARASGDVRAGSWVREFVGELDRMLLLESPRFDAAYERFRDEYHRLEIRQSMFAGSSYPEAADAAARFVDDHFAAAERQRQESGAPAATAGAVPRAILAPHLDPRRAGVTIARALLEIGDAPDGPLRVVVFGVGHQMWGDVVALTRKHFETPFGKLPCDTAFVDDLAAALGEAAYRGEVTHRDEHSIEFAAVYLKRRFRDRPVTLVPILVGGFHALLDEGMKPREVPELEALFAALRDAERRHGGRTVYLAAVDLSHVGPRFGDPAPDERILGEVEARDREALEAARRGDADGWFEAIAKHEDSTRVCGWGATYAALRAAAPGEGRLLRYEQSREDDGSLVSVAAIAWP